MKSKLTTAFYTVVAFIASHKITTAIVLAVVAALTATAIIISSILSAPADVLSSGGNKINGTVSDTTASQAESVTSEPQEVVSSEETPISSETPSSKPETPAPQPSKPATPNTDYNYNSNMSYDNNVFLDALKYTGYKTDPAMWGSYGNYVLCSQKRGRGWLSEITYDNSGSATGYETNAQGLPDIHYFTYRSNGSKRGLVCASYVAYVYFNYLPNVAGIDTSMLPKAGDPVLANEWYIAAKKWVDLGYSRYINYTANDGGSIYQDLKITPEEEIPIGSLIFLCDWYNRTNWSTHVSIYAGKVNGYHWVTHVGNENGPELCAIERMNRLPHPQWMLAIITPPSNIRFSPAVEVTVKDENGKPMKDVEISVKRISNGVVTNLGKTDANGKVNGEGFSYGEYEIIQKTPSGYTCAHSTQKVSLTTKNNSLNAVTFTNKNEDKKPAESSKEDVSDNSELSN
ncbi:MAG: hypothetical protein E7521_07360 [Ruminococcaceae bacterium]|nr:hypothetical protein [Oscillospiraceae bacterium]